MMRPRTSRRFAPSAVRWAVVIVAVVLQPVLLSLHLTLIPHTLAPATRFLVHTHAHHRLHRHALDTTKEPQLSCRVHASSQGDEGLHACPFALFLHQPSHGSLHIVDTHPATRVFRAFSGRPSQALAAPAARYLLAPKHSPPV